MRRYGLGVGAVFLAMALAASRAGAEVAIDRAPIVGEPSDPASQAFVVVNGGGGLPENGAVLIKGPYDTNVSVLATATGLAPASGNVPQVEGTVTHIEESPYWVWRPAAPLVAGSNLQLELVSGDALVPGSIGTLTVVPAIVLGRPALALAPSASLISVISEKACCRARLGRTATLEASAPCFAVESEASIQLDPGVSTSAPRLQANQYLFRFDTGPDARPSFTDGSLGGVVLPIFREQAEEYCVSVTAIELPTLTEYPYENPAACAAHGTLADLGTSPTEPGPTDLIRNLCQAPPLGFEAPWCEVNAACEDDEAGASCELYPHVCNGEPLLPLPEPFDPEPSTDAALPEGDGGGDSDAGPDGSPNSSTGGSGCTVADPSRSRRAALPLGLALALAGLARRRRIIGPKCANGERDRAR